LRGPSRTGSAPAVRRLLPHDWAALPVTGDEERAMPDAWRKGGPEADARSILKGIHPGEMRGQSADPSGEGTPVGLFDRLPTLSQFGPLPAVDALLQKIDIAAIGNDRFGAQLRATRHLWIASRTQSSGHWEVPACEYPCLADACAGPSDMKSTLRRRRPFIVIAVTVKRRRAGRTRWKSISIRKP